MKIIEILQAIEQSDQEKIEQLILAIEGNSDFKRIADYLKGDLIFSVSPPKS